VALYNFLKNRKDGIDTVVDGWALSAGSFLMLAGEKRTMGEAAMVMVHSAWGMAVGNGDDMRKQADLLDKVNSQIRGIYTSVTGQDEATVDEWLSSTDGHWFSAAEAVELGFATETVASAKMAAKFDPSVFAARYNAPQAALEVFQPTEQELMKIEELQAALDAANARVAELDAAKTAAEADLATAKESIGELKASLVDIAAQHEAAKAVIAAQRASRIEAGIDSLIAAKRVKAEGKDALLAACIAAADDGAAILSAIPEAPAAPVGVIIATSARAQEPDKSITRAQLDAMPHSERALFFRNGGKVRE
jgi:hypothetical protein